MWIPRHEAMTDTGHNYTPAFRRVQPAINRPRRVGGMRVASRNRTAVSHVKTPCGGACAERCAGACRGWQQDEGTQQPT